MSDLDRPVAGNARNRSRQNIILVCATVVLLIAGGVALFVTGGKPPVAQPKPVTTSIQAPGTLDQQDAWRAQSEARIGMLTDEVKKLRSDLGSTRTDLAKTASTAVAAQAAAASAASAVATASTPAAAAQPGSGAVGTSGSRLNGSTALNAPLPAGAATPGRGLGGQRVLNAPGILNQSIDALTGGEKKLEIIDFDDADGAGTSAGSATSGLSKLATRIATVGKNAADSKINLLPAGSFIPVAMLNGVDAPTGGQAQSDPLSVDLQILKPANLPNGKRLDLTGCRVVSSAWGDLSSERMMGRTETLSCVLGDHAIELAIKGKLIGEDGKEGVRGRLVTKQGSVLANALLAGTLSGVGQAFQQSSMVTSVGGGGIAQTFDGSRIGSAAAGGGISSAANMLAQYYLKTADKLFPVIETDAARTIEIEVLTGLNVDAATATLFTDRGSRASARDRNRFRSQAHD